jgi:hypothetical protein
MITWPYDRIRGFLMLCSVCRWLCSDKLTRWMLRVSLEIRFCDKSDCHLFLSERGAEGRFEQVAEPFKDVEAKIEAQNCV